MKSIDKYGSICCEFRLLTLRASICYAQLHMYVYIDITIVYDMLSIV